MNQSNKIPYSRQTIEQIDIDAVVDVLKSDWLTTGPKVKEFEDSVADFVRADHAIAVNSGTAALHCMLHCSGIAEGDEVIVPANSFVATANAVLYCNATPVFADIDEESFLICPDDVQAKITPRTKAIIAVDYAGHPCDYDRLREICQKNGCYLFSDSSHALGATWKLKTVAELVDACTYSFHPVKPLTCGEGGLIATNHPLLSERIHRFRSHGIESDHHQRSVKGTWQYDMRDLGYNYRISDIQCALGLSQLSRLNQWEKRRTEIATIYREHFDLLPDVFPQKKSKVATHAYHLFAVLMRDQEQRNRMFQEMRQAGIGVNVHYQPIYLHSYYQKLGYHRGICPVAESTYERILSLPIFPTMTDQQIEFTLDVVQKQSPQIRIAA